MDRQAEHRPLTAGIQADGDRVDGLGELSEFWFWYPHGSGLVAAHPSTSRHPMKRDPMKTEVLILNAPTLSLSVPALVVGASSIIDVVGVNIRAAVWILCLASLPAERPYPLYRILHRQLEARRTHFQGNRCPRQ